MNSGSRGQQPNPARSLYKSPREFIAWLGRGKEVRSLVEGGHVEAAYAGEIRAYINELDKRRSLKNLGKEITGQIPHLTPTQRRALRKASFRAREAYLDFLKLSRRLCDGYVRLLKNLRIG